MMSQEVNLRLARQLLAGMGQGLDPQEIAALFSVDVRFEIAGDVGALPWIGQQAGRSAVAAFIRDQRDLLQPIRFDVQSIMADNDRAVIVGELASTLKLSGNRIDTAFALVLTVTSGQITRFQMLEDSFAVSQAARLKPVETG